MDLKEPGNATANPKMDLNDFALIDEISGITNFLENFMVQNDLPETVHQRIRSRMFTYNSDKPKEIRLNEIRNTIFGTGR